MNHRRLTTAAGGVYRRRSGDLVVLVLLLLLLVIPWSADAQTSSPPSSDDNNSSSSSSSNSNPYGFSTNFNPSMAIVIVVLISAFFFLGFFSIYIRNCGGSGDAAAGSVAAARGGGAARSRLNRGLDPEVLATFPTLIYSEAKELKIGKGALECAVCLSEFEDDETLRLLPHCSHAFHPDCIDAWLESHVTCPVCRSDLAAPAPAAEGPIQDPAAAPDHVAVDLGGEAPVADRKAEFAELARIASRRRGGSRLFPRSHSTGHSVAFVRQAEESHDRFTLRLPEHVHREIVAAGRMRRAESMRGFPAGGEGSSRRGYRGGVGIGIGVGEGSSRGGRTIRLGRSGRWPSFFIRNMSMKIPAWAAGRKLDGEGSVKKGEGGDGSTRGKLSSVRAQFDCLGGGGKLDYAGGDDGSTSAVLGRV